MKKSTVLIKHVSNAAHAQDTHAKLRRLTDMIAALLVHRLEATKKVPTAPPEMKVWSRLGFVHTLQSVHLTFLKSVVPDVCTKGFVRNEGSLRHS